MMRTLLLLLPLILAAESDLRPRFLVLTDQVTRPRGQNNGGNGALQVATASNGLAFPLFHALRGEESSVFSPYSITLALSMLHEGARHQTAAELRNVLNLDDAAISDENLGETMREGQQVLKQQVGANEMQVANTLLVQQGSGVLPIYQRVLKDYYNASVQEVDFQNRGEQVVQLVNRWSAYNTRNKIPSLLEEPLSPLTRVFLVNAVYFKGTWETKFDPRSTSSGEFFNLGTDPVEVPMMRTKSKFRFAQVPKYEISAIELPYDGRGAGMLLLLPQEKTGLPRLERTLTEYSLDSIVTQLREDTVQVTIPKFKLEKSHGMVDALKAVGALSMFNEDKADFSGITGKKDLHVDKVIHKVILEVNEEGSEAAAVTGVSAVVRVGGYPSQTFQADHPFLFFIRDTKSGLIHFMGRVSTL